MSMPVPEVVGIGASAGGLEALQALLPQLRANGRTAYVVAQHMALDAHHELVKALLQRCSALPVRLMEEGESCVVDAVTLVPAGRHAQWQQGHWTLRDPAGAFFSTPSVDALFVSLAQGLGPAAVGVVLSGAGSDGALGSLALQRAGARVWVQSPTQARFSGMPQAVLDAADPTSPLVSAQLAEQMAEGWLPKGHEPPAQHARQGDLAPLLALLRAGTGVDFSGYKPETLERRLDKRLQELGLDSVDAYTDHARQHPDELPLLQRRFLVSVSSFYRDRQAFEALALAWRTEASGAQPVHRCLVPACASGEEAYTLSMLHADGVAAGHWPAGLEVLGVDLNREALDQAERGCYGIKALQEVNEGERARHFDFTPPDHRVRNAIRAPVRFQHANVLEAVPPGPWDTVSCRNLLIYLKTPVQEQLIAAFHRCLRPGGWLLLSPSETLTQASLRLFAPYDMQNRLFRRLP